MAESREQALDRLRAEAAARGANAVIGVEFVTAMVMQGASKSLSSEPPSYSSRRTTDPQRACTTSRIMVA